MKKSVIAFTVAALCSVSVVVQADTTLYGSARVSVDYDDADSPKDSGLDDPDSNWDIFNNASRLGVQGS